MEIILLNSVFEKIDVIDTFNSFIWTDRYYGFGDFELVLPPNTNKWEALETTRYLKLKESIHTMMLESINIRSEIEDSDQLIIGGRSLESMLNRRIIWSPTVLTGDFQDAIKLLLDQNVIVPSVTERDITNFEFLASTDPSITVLDVTGQYFGEDVYKAISELCISKEVGFKITLTDTNQFRFELYNGLDRTYDQTDRPYVIFSPDFDNLINSDYIETNELLKTVVLVAGEQGVGNTRLTVTVESTEGAGSGLNRREMFKEANDVSRNTSSGKLTDEEYFDLLEGKGLQELAKAIFIQAFDGEVDTTMYKYNEDFYMGDILQIQDRYGHSAKTRVIEMIYSQDENGEKMYPTFSTI